MLRDASARKPNHGNEASGLDVIVNPAGAGGQFIDPFGQCSSVVRRFVRWVEEIEDSTRQGQARGDEFDFERLFQTRTASFHGESKAIRIWLTIAPLIDVRAASGYARRACNLKHQNPIRAICPAECGWVTSSCSPSACRGIGRRMTFGWFWDFRCGRL